MLKTGNIVIDYFLVVVKFLPLLPAGLIFFRQRYLKEPLNFLLIVCLLNFLAGFARQSSFLNTDNHSIINNVFSILEWLLLTQLFKPILGKGTKDPLNILLLVFLSIQVTFYSLKGWDHSNPVLNTIQNCLIIGVVLLSLPPLVRSTDLTVFESSLFWIAGGCLFYFPILILVEWVGTGWLPLCNCPDTEKMMMLAIADCMRYLLFTLAILLCPPRNLPGAS